MERRRLCLRLPAVAALAAPAAAAEPSAATAVGDLFFRSCVGLERAEPRRSDTWAWVEDLCRREAALKRDLFTAADRAGRLRLLADECAAWYRRNVWRLPDRLRDDPGARGAYVLAVCAAEAEERLRDLDGG